jgi:hypothetical protein
VPKMRLEGLSLLKIEKIICYLVIMTGFLGSALLAVNVGNYNVSLFRILFILLWAAIVAAMMFTSRRLSRYQSFCGLLRLTRGFFSLKTAV